MIDTRGRLTGAALVLGITCAFLLPGVWAAGEQAAKVASIQNQVESRADGATDWKGATLNQALHERDRIRTGPGSRAPSPPKSRAWPNSSWWCRLRTVS